MIYYEDLLNVPYKPHGRTPQEGFDCIGLPIFCVKRSGRHLKDPWYDRLKIPHEEIKSYILQGLNVREIPAPKADELVSFSYKGNVHCGYLIDKNNVLHVTPLNGVKLSPLAAMGAAVFYEVINENNMV